MLVVDSLVGHLLILFESISEWIVISTILGTTKKGFPL